LVLLLASVITEPPAGAGADNVTVQEELPGALTVPGEQFRLEGTTVAVTERLTVVDWVWPLSVPLMVAVWPLSMVPLVAMKVVPI
jgi:hypothetical protein